MTESVEPTGAAPAVKSGVLARLAATRWAVAAAVAILLGLAAFGRLAPLEALVAIAVVLAAAVMPWPRRLPATSASPATRSPLPPAVDPQLAAVLAALPEAALLADRRGTLLAGNDAAIAMLGPLRRGEPLSFTLRAPELIEAVRAVADGETRRVEFTERVPVERTLEAHVVPIAFERTHKPAPAPDLLLLTFRDLTEQRRLDRMRADFVANASHELRTPLASLTGFIETLLGSAREDAAARERFLGIMAEQAHRMSRLIDDLLSLSRVELHEHVRPQTVVDLVPIVVHVCEELAPLARERGVSLEIMRDAGSLPVQGDRDELVRLFENLVENALKYGASGKRVEVAIGSEPTAGGAEALVAVRDFGPGIAPEHLPRLTERFYRVDVETSRAEGGTGLGLAIVKHILARHRGQLAIESELGRGASFTVRIPLAAPAVPETPSGTSA